MKIVISGGGTAGHINPAIAVALELEERGHEVCYIGTPTGLEANLATAAGLSFKGFPAAGFDRSKRLSLVTSSFKVLESARKARKFLKEEAYDGVVGFGGYVSLPIGLAAHRQHLPLVIHEQNSVPGLANKTLASKAQALALTYGYSLQYFKQEDADKAVVTGNPVRQSVLASDGVRGRALFDIPADALFLLVFGGSLGAKHLNEAIISQKDELMALEHLYVVQSTGEKSYEQTVEALGDLAGPRWQVVPYIDQMGDALCGCDVVVSRAGATSLAEITALGKPSLLVPFPFATEDHQTKNADGLVEVGASMRVADDRLDTPEFSSKLFEILSDRELRARMAIATSTFGKPDATDNVVDLVVKTISHHTAKH
jgi:UDP-N-acetylglucosamine--N-acetylmuramyl-(pentapeptide) pyrophosphoryl-undecaprenol N-acetylglucosamine transferase